MIVVLVLIFTNTRGGGGNALTAKLTVWGLDDAKVFDQIKYGYIKTQPGVTVNYVQVNNVEYDSKLLEALALGEGPDVFIVRSGSLLKDRAKLAPVSATQFGLVNLRDSFPQVVEQDFVSGGKIYALPLFIDTLALFYNKDFFDQASIVYPPQTWDDFQADVPLLRQTDEFGNIARAGAAIGGTEKTIGAAGDILSMLMLQNGTKMISSDLQSAIFAGDGARGPGAQALNFYTQFANPASKFYTWNDGRGEALSGFASGKAAMVLGYRRDLSTIKKKSPFLNLGVAPSPQVNKDDTLTYASYEGFGVSKRSVYQAVAWDFVIYAATNLNSQRTYFKTTQKPPALKKLIAELINDPEMQVFARQALTARSWTRVDDVQTKQIFSDAISDVLLSGSDVNKALTKAQTRVTQILRAKR